MPVPRASAQWLVSLVLLLAPRLPAENPAECGVRRADSGGKAPQGSSWPWQVRLELATQNKHFCGGAVISEYWVITAAHCFLPPVPQNLREIVVVTGLNDQLRPEQWARYTSPHDIIMHEEFNEQTGENDIALVRMGERVKFGEHVLPVCLPDRDTFFNSHWSACYLTGWMKSGEETSDLLQEVPVTFVSFKDCNDTIFSGELQPSMMCMDFKDRELACHLESGGPVVCEAGSRQQFFQIGLVSWVNDCSQRWPGVFTMAVHYLNWIQRVTARYGKVFDLGQYGPNNVTQRSKHRNRGGVIVLPLENHTTVYRPCRPPSLSSRDRATLVTFVEASSGSARCSSVIGMAIVHIRSFMLTVLAT